MSKSTTSRPALPAALSCGCNRCSCSTQPTGCSCHSLNALLAITLWECGRALRQRSSGRR